MRVVLLGLKSRESLQAHVVHRLVRIVPVIVHIVAFSSVVGEASVNVLWGHWLLLGKHIGFVGSGVALQRVGRAHRDSCDWVVW